MWNRRTDRRVEKRWAPTAAVIGFWLTIGLATISDLPLNWFVVILCPVPVILARLHVSAGIGEHSKLAFFVAFSHIGNAVWSALIAESVRLAVRRLTPSQR
jgi:hypothetical protein